MTPGAPPADGGVSTIAAFLSPKKDDIDEADGDGKDGADGQEDGSQPAELEEQKVPSPPGSKMSDEKPVVKAASPQPADESS